MPEGARANTPDGAKAFTLYFGESINRAFADLNGDLINRLSLTTCKTCSGAVTAIGDYKSRGEKYVGEYANFTSATYSGVSDGVTRVIVVSTTNGAKVVDNSGATVKTIKPSTGNLSVQLRYDNGWRVAEIQGVG